MTQPLELSTENLMMGNFTLDFRKPLRAEIIASNSDIEIRLKELKVRILCSDMNQADNLLEVLTGRSYQDGVDSWSRECFKGDINAALSVAERRNRFMEECIELFQAVGGTPKMLHEIGTYVFNRPRGVIAQEVGGVMVTLAGLCNACGINLREAARQELNRVWKKISTIRQKHLSKPRESVLPGRAPDDPGVDYVQPTKSLVKRFFEVLRRTYD